MFLGNTILPIAVAAYAKEHHAVLFTNDGLVITGKGF